MQNSIKLKEADIQDLAQLIVDFVCRHGSCHKEMDLLAKRFDVPLSATTLQSSLAISSRAYALLQYVNGTPKLLEIIDYILQKGFNQKTPDLDKYSKILAKYGFAIVPEADRFKLTHISSGLLEHERRIVASWIEQHANSKVLSHLRDAKDNIGLGRPDYALSDCRKALEALTIGSASFSDSLNELVEENIILQGSKERKMDAELLRTIYGYCSTVGSHTSAKSVKPDIEQAVLGLQITESCIYFLLRRIEAAKKNGKKLKYWAEVRS